jgi:hypothetical protein
MVVMDVNAATLGGRLIHILPEQIAQWQGRWDAGCTKGLESSPARDLPIWETLVVHDGSYQV